MLSGPARARPSTPCSCVTSAWRSSGSASNTALFAREKTTEGSGSFSPPSRPVRQRSTAGTEPSAVRESAADGSQRCRERRCVVLGVLSVPDMVSFFSVCSGSRGFIPSTHPLCARSWRLDNRRPFVDGALTARWSCSNLLLDRHHRPHRLLVRQTALRAISFPLLHSLPGMHTSTFVLNESAATSSSAMCTAASAPLSAP